MIGTSLTAEDIEQFEQFIVLMSSMPLEKQRIVVGGIDALSAKKRNWIVALTLVAIGAATTAAIISNTPPTVVALTVVASVLLAALLALKILRIL